MLSLEKLSFKTDCCHLQDNKNPEANDSTDSGNVSAEQRIPLGMVYQMDEGASYKIGDLGHVVSIDSVTTSPEEGDCRYMAPELLNEKVDKHLLCKCDVFSLGLSIYEAASLVNLPKNSTEGDYQMYKEGGAPDIDGYSKEFNHIVRVSTVMTLLLVLISSRIWLFVWQH